MANVNSAYGLRALGNLSATGAQKQYGYTIDDNQSGIIYQGDLVTVVAGFLVKFAPQTHVSSVGVFNGCFYNDPTTQKPTWKNYYPGSINITSGSIVASVIDDPSQLFTIQVNGTMTQAAIGNNADVSQSTTGSTITGVSNMTLDFNTQATTAALNLKIVGLFETPNNALGANAQVVVKINEHRYGSPGVAST